MPEQSKQPEVTASLTIDVEELSDPRQPGELAMRFEDLFNYSYDICESLYSDVELSEKSIYKFILNMLNVRSLIWINLCVTLSF